MYCAHSQLLVDTTNKSKRSCVHNCVESALNGEADDAIHRNLQVPFSRFFLSPKCPEKTLRILTLKEACKYGNYDNKHDLWKPAFDAKPVTFHVSLENNTSKDSTQ